MVWVIVATVAKLFGFRRSCASDGLFIGLAIENLTAVAWIRSIHFAEQAFTATLFEVQNYVHTDLAQLKVWEPYHNGQ